MEFIDISMPITERLPIYPGDTRPTMTPICTIEKSGCNMTELIISTHTGTHIDAPSHFLNCGTTIDKIELYRFFGKATVVEVLGDEINAHAIERSINEDTERILFKTTNSELLNTNRFSKKYVYLTEDGAEFLVYKGILLVGIDYVTIEKFGTPDFKVHKILLSAGIPILEGLHLKDVQPGEYTLVALPLRLCGLDGSPVRAVLKK